MIMTRVRVAIVALAATASARCAGTFAAAPAPIPRDPGGPCLQLGSRHEGKRMRYTLWRGDRLVGTDLSHDGLNAALIEATGDNPAAAAEARSRQRTTRLAMTLGIAGPATSVLILAAAPTDSHRPEQRTTGTVLFVAGAALMIASIATGTILDWTVAPRHLDDAINIYNANPPPGCGPAAPGADGRGSE